MPAQKPAHPPGAGPEIVPAPAQLPRLLAQVCLPYAVVEPKSLHGPLHDEQLSFSAQDRLISVLPDVLFIQQGSEVRNLSTGFLF